MGLGYFLEARIAGELSRGSLILALPSEAAAGAPFHMYYSSRRHNHPALRTLRNIVRRQNGMSKITNLAEQRGIGDELTSAVRH